MTTASKQRHWLDDPLTDRGLAAVGAGIQLWSTYFMVLLMHWAYGSWAVALVNVLFYDLIGLITARVGAEDRNSPRVRRFAWTIAGSCFAFTFAANLLSHQLLDGAGTSRFTGMEDVQAWVRNIVGSLPVALLVATLVLRLMMAAYRRQVIADEERQRDRDVIRAEREAAAAAAAERAAAERAELERQDREREAGVRAERERLEREAQAAVDRAAESSAAAAWQERYDALPGDSKTAKARAYVLAERRAGREPNGEDVDEVVGGKTLGRKVLRELAADGHLPLGQRPQLVAGSG